MRKRLAVLILLPVLVAGTWGCDSDDVVPPEVDETLLQLAECTGLGVQNLAGVFNGLFGIVEAVEEGLLPPGVTWNPMTGEFSASIDLDEDGFDDGTLSGTVGGPYDDWDVGEAITIDWALSTFGGLTGEGLWSISKLSVTSLRLTGGTDIEGGEACLLEITSTNLTVNLLTIEEGGPTGTIGFRVVAGPDSIENGLIIFQDGVDTATVTGTYDGAVFEFQLNLDTWEPDFS